MLSKHRGLAITVVAKHMPGDYDIEYASPWAGANYFPVAKPGSLLQRLEKATWAELDRLCRHVPEAGIHFQDTKIYGRAKDFGTATGQWFEELTKEDAWFKDVVPNVGSFTWCRLFMCFILADILTLISFVSCPKANSHKAATLAPTSPRYASTQPSTCPGWSASA